MEKKTELEAVEEFHLGGDKEAEEYYLEEGPDYIVVDAVSEALDAVQDFIQVRLLMAHCPKISCAEIRLAVEEIFINICSYAYAPNVGRARVRCRVKEDESYVQLQFSDHGTPFDPLKKEDADTTGKQFMEREGGFGIHLVKNMMDEVAYEYRDGMNILKVKRFFPS